MFSCIGSNDGSSALDHDSKPVDLNAFKNKLSRKFGVRESNSSGKLLFVYEEFLWECIEVKPGLTGTLFRASRAAAATQKNKK